MSEKEISEIIGAWNRHVYSRRQEIVREWLEVHGYDPETGEIPAKEWFVFTSHVMRETRGMWAVTRGLAETYRRDGWDVRLNMQDETLELFGRI